MSRHYPHAAAVVTATHESFTRGVECSYSVYKVDGERIAVVRGNGRSQYYHGWCRASINELRSWPRTVARLTQRKSEVVYTRLPTLEGAS